MECITCIILGSIVYLTKMKKIVFIILASGALAYANAQTGIGTTMPAVKLHVKSNGSTFRLEGTDHVYMELFPQGSTTRYAYFGFPSAASTTLTMMNNNASGTIALGTNNTTRLTIDNSGNTSLSGNLTGGNVATSKLSGFVSNTSSVSSSRSISANDNGMILKCNAAITLSLPASGIPEGFNCMILQQGTGQVTFSGTFSNRNSFTKTAGQFAIATILYIDGVYIVSGEMSN